MPNDHPAGVDPDAQPRGDLINILRFLQALLETHDKIVFDMADYPVALTERDLVGKDGAPLPGIAFGPSEDIWLAFDRLAERPPPAAQPTLAPWLRRESRPSPAQPPALLAERVVQVSAEAASDLAEAELADAEMMGEVPVGSREAPEWAVPLRPAELPDIVAAMQVYIGGPWRAWSDEEGPRRQSIALYQSLFKHQAALAAGGGEALELVVGIGLARWQFRGRRIDVPLIEQRVEFELDLSNGRLSVVPRAVPPIMSLRAFGALGIAATASLQRQATELLDTIVRDRDLPFGPTQRLSFLGVLEMCAARLDSSAIVLPAGEELGPPERLRISPSFCIIVRQRRDDILRSDIERLTGVLSGSETPLPRVGRRFVVPASDTPVGQGGGPPRSPPATDPPIQEGGDRLFFPLPANAEQEEIARQLDQPHVDGVVVQGPPGTGKTHTIANIVGHAMAKGERVLVAAHTAEALVAIRDKLPGPLQDLVIAVTHSDREGARQLEQAVTTLADRAQTLPVRETEERTQDLLGAIDRADARIRAIGAELQAIARANLTEIAWRGGTALPQTIATWTAAQGDRHVWLDDHLDLTPIFELRFGEAEIAEARAIRRRLGADLTYQPGDLLAVTRTLPGVAEIVTAHRALREAGDRQTQEVGQNLPRPDLTVAAPDELAALLAWLEHLEAWRDRCGEHPWLPLAWEALAVSRPMGRLDTKTLRELCEGLASLSDRGDVLTLHAVHLPESDKPDCARAAGIGTEALRSVRRLWG